MLRVVLILLTTRLVPVLASEICLCTESDIPLRTLPSPTAPVPGKLTEGQCVKLSQFKRIGQWLQVKGEEGTSGFLLESDVLKVKPCRGDVFKRVSSCPTFCNTSCCNAKESSHHHPVWSTWSPCSVSCGEGISHRTCRNHCSSLSSHTQIRTCHHHSSCPVWSHWSQCSRSCGGGTIHRTCTNHCSSLSSHTQTRTCHHHFSCPVATHVHVHDHVCNKEGIIQAIAFRIPENCTGFDQSHGPPTQKFVVDNCEAPVSVQEWVIGSKINGHCHQTPMYSPVFTFFNGHGDDQAGVFVGCDENGEFKIITGRCGHHLKIQHVSNRTSYFDHIYRIKW